jgi:hypothetical protein
VAADAATPGFPGWEKSHINRQLIFRETTDCGLSCFGKSAIERGVLALCRLSVKNGPTR